MVKRREPAGVKTVAVHLQVPYLEVPIRWRVGDAVFWPGGMLRRRLLRRGQLSSGPWEHILKPLVDERWATVRVMVCTEHNDGRIEATPVVAAARGAMRDAVAVLSLFARARVPRFDTSDQRFGLALDVASVREDSWVTDPPGRWRASGSRRHGTLGAWTFTTEDIEAYRRDDRFNLLDSLLRSDDRTPWQRRLLAALRTWSIANTTYRPATRLVLAATTLEALFGDDYQPRKAATGGHQLARRGAFLWCGAESGNPHGPGRPACPFLVAAGQGDLDRRLATSGAVCDYYGELRSIIEARNAALHGARDDFPERAARAAEYAVEQLLLLTIAWVAETGGSAFGEYLAAIDQVPTD